MMIFIKLELRGVSIGTIANRNMQDTRAHNTESQSFCFPIILTMTKRAANTNMRNIFASIHMTMFKVVSVPKTKGRPAIPPPTIGINLMLASMASKGRGLYGKGKDGKEKKTGSQAILKRSSTGRAFWKRWHMTRAGRLFPAAS